MKLNLRISLISFILAGMAISSITVAQNTSILYFSSESQRISQQEVFEVDIMVDSQGEYVNAIAAYFSYPEDMLEVIDIDTSESVMPFFVEKNTSSGKVEIIGGKPTPGFAGINKVASVKFRVKVDSGTVTLSFVKGSVVLTNAGNQDILDLSASEPGTYTVENPIQ